MAVLGGIPSAFFLLSHKHQPPSTVYYSPLNPFNRQMNNDSDEILLDEIEDYIVGCVVRYFGCYSGKILEEMTHSEMPWILTRRGLKKDVGCNRIIEKEFIDTYFKNVKDKYKLISIDDIKEYSTTLFNSIN